jgi:hypothetical protein
MQTPRRLVLAWIAGVSALAAPVRADIVVFADGLVHNVSDNTYASDSILVEDPPSGISPTTLNLTAGTIGLHFQESEEEPFSVCWSIQAIASHGARANVNILGGSTLGTIESLDASCTIVDGGSVGAFCVRVGIRADAGDGSDTAVVRVISGSVLGAVEVRDGARATLEADSLSIDFNGVSVFAFGSARPAVANVEGGTLPGSVHAGARGFVTVANAGVGADLGGLSVLAHSGGVVKVAGGTHLGAVSVFQGGRVEIATGSFGADQAISLGARSGGVIQVSSGTFSGGAVAYPGGQLGIRAGSVGEIVRGIADQRSVHVNEASSVNLSGGSFSKGVLVAGGSMRIAAGSIGPGSPLGIGTEASVSAFANAPQTAEVQIFGGSFAQGFLAERNATIHVYGTGLAKSGGMVMGTLQDGTPIAVDYTESDNGQVLLHGPLEITGIPIASFGLEVGSDILFRLPSSLRPPEPDCLGGFELAPAVGFELARQGGLTFLVSEEATNPGEPDYQASVPIELVTLELASLDPVDVGSGTSQNLFVTLQDARGLHAADPPPGPASTGTLTLDFAMHTFTLTTEVFYDLRKGALTAPILASGSDTISTPSPAPWAPVPPPSAPADLPAGGFFPGVIAGGAHAFLLEGTSLSLTVQTPAGPKPASLPVLGLPGLILLASLLAACGVRRGSE